MTDDDKAKQLEQAKAHVKEFLGELFEGKKMYDYLKIMVIGHYVFAIVLVFSALTSFSFIFRLIQQFVSSDPAAFKNLLSYAFPFIYGFLKLAFGGAIFLNGRFLSQRKNYKFCRIVSFVECISMPIGTLLGFFTLVALWMDPVKKLFYSDLPGGDSASEYYKADDTYDRG